jgi:hypothetical protein
MTDDAFERLEQDLQAGGPEAGFEWLAQKFRQEKNYPLLLEARLMKKRHELGMALVQSEPLADFPTEKQKAYEECFIEAAREAGSLFLADGEIARAWPYFRAIGEPAPVAAAIEKVQAGDGIESVIEIAFHEGVHPRKGFDLILEQYGVCRAITSLQQFPGRQGREDCLRRLVRTVHRDLLESLKRAIERAEGQVPETDNIPALIAGRDWLFGEHDYYLDTSHVVSVIQFSAETSDPETLALTIELADYGKCLSNMFKGEPPFDNVFIDYGVYLRALLGQDVEPAIAHFRRKVAETDPAQAGSRPAQVLVGLLARLERYREAIEVSLDHLREVDSNQLVCPSVFQLCEMAGDFEQLRKLAREHGDLLSFTAAALRLAG